MLPIPSQVVDQKSLSPSSNFSEVVHLENKRRQVGYWKSANVPNYHASSGTVASSPLEKFIPAKHKLLTSMKHCDPFLLQDQKLKLISNKQSVGMDRQGSQSATLLKSVDCDVGTQSLRSSSYLVQRNEVNVMGAQCESSLFSSSLSELFTKKVRLSSNYALYGHSVDPVASHYEEEEQLQSLEDLEAQTIGNLLPDDDDLLSGLTDGLDFFIQQSGGEDGEDLDFFSNVGGMDLGDDGLSMGVKNSESSSHGQPAMCNGSVAGEHPLGEHPSRTLFVRNINSNVEDSELRALFEQYGDIHTLYTACKHRGFVMISYYDIRGARNAMKALQNKPLRRRKLDIHFSIPKDNPSEKDINQGSFVVLNLDSNVSNEELFQIFGAYGEVREVKEVPHKSCHKIIEFYDIRAAEAALCALNWSEIVGKKIKLEPNHTVRGRWSLPQQFHPDLEKEDVGPYLQQSSAPMNRAVGLPALNLKGGNTCSSVDNGPLLGLHSALQLQSLETVSNNGISSSVPSSLSSQMRAESTGNKSGFVDSGHSPCLLKFQAAPTFHPHSLPEYHDGLYSRAHFNTLSPMAGKVSLRPLETMDNQQRCHIISNASFGSAGNGNCALPGHQYTWGNSYHPQPPGMVWPNSPSYVNGIRPTHPPPQLQGVPRAPSHMLPTVFAINNHVGSAPSVNPSMWDRQRAYAVDSPEFSGFLPGSLGNRKVSSDSPHSAEFVSHIFAQVGGNCIDLPMPERNVGFQPHHQRCMIFPGRNQILSSISSFDYPCERSRSRRNEGGSNQVENKKQYELDIDRIRLGEDIRTTLMIKNIPNKYTSKMLLAAIDEYHRGDYDFIYLPIDFKNKCNVGYAFINMTDPSLIIPFHETFNGKKWEKFNSEKVASLAYARIQGKAALVAHFQNSSLMNEDKRCRPILFNTEGPNAGDQVPFPMGVNVRTRAGKGRNNSCEESLSESPLNSFVGDDCFVEEESSLGSEKVSDQAEHDFCEH